MEQWFNQALDYLIDKLRDNPHGDASIYFTDFIEDNRDRLFEDLVYGDIEEFSEYHFSNFQKWVSLTESPGVSIDSQGRWRLGDNVDDLNSESSPDFDYLSERDIELLGFDIDLCTSELYEEYYSLLQKLESKNHYMRTFRCAHRLAVCASDFDGISTRNKGELWFSAATHAEKILKEGISENIEDMKYSVVDFYSKSAALYERDKYNSGAVESYKSCYGVLDSLDNYPDGNTTCREGFGPLDSKKLEVLKAWRIQTQIIGEHDDASDLYVEEMNLVRKNSKYLSYLWFLFYGLMSGYGERPGRVIVSIVLVVVFFTILVFGLAIDYSVGGSEKSLQPFDSFYYVVVTFTTLGYGDIYPVTTGGKVISNILSLSGLFLSGMFVATIVRRYSRG
ncbi:MAG: potassium channel family protein [Pseudomonadota bacterium]|nr:potassium channel family protein [Pseudomonadota bacterium]